MMEIQVGALIFAGMGLLFLLIGIFLMKVFGRRRKTASMVTTARVVDVKCRRDSGGSTYYYPVFEYYAGGRMQRVVSTFGSSPCRYQTGEETELHYDPEKPGKILVRTRYKNDEAALRYFHGNRRDFSCIGHRFYGNRSILTVIVEKFGGSRGKRKSRGIKGWMCVLKY